MIVNESEGGTERRKRIGQARARRWSRLSHRWRQYMILVRILMRCCRGQSCGGTTDEHDELPDFRILAHLLEQCHDAILFRSAEVGLLSLRLPQ
jgi:hypothetical protein